MHWESSIVVLGRVVITGTSLLSVGIVFMFTFHVHMFVLLF